MQHPEAELSLKIICFLHLRYHPKIIADILKTVQKPSASVLMRLYINDSGNEAEYEKKITKKQY